MVRISFVNDHTFKTCLPPVGAVLPPLEVEGEEPPSPLVEGACVDPPPQAANSMLASISRLKTKKIDLRMFFSFKIDFL
jgi:hypothetical protein